MNHHDIQALTLTFHRLLLAQKAGDAAEFVLARSQLQEAGVTVELAAPMPAAAYKRYYAATRGTP